MRRTLGSLGAGEWIRRAIGAAVLVAVAAIGLGADTGFLTRASLAGTNRSEQGLLDRLVIGAVGWTSSELSVELEILLLPLTLRGKTHMRIMGAIAPLNVPFWIGATPVETLAITGHRFLGPRHDRVPIPVVTIPEDVADIRRHLVVHDGGQR